MKAYELIAIIKTDLDNKHGSNFLCFCKKILLSNSFKLLLNYRIGRFFFQRGNLLICKLLQHRQIKRFSCQISYKAEIGAKLSLPHPIGIVIGEGVVIGNNVKIWQNVTLGSHGKKDEKLNYPVIEDGVKIFAGSMIIGGVNVKKNGIVGGLSLVLSDVEINSKVAGIPAKVIK